jgi:hypothetical protein
MAASRLLVSSPWIFHTFFPVLVAISNSIPIAIPGACIGNAAWQPFRGSGTSAKKWRTGPGAFESHSRMHDRESLLPNRRKPQKRRSTDARSSACRRRWSLRLWILESDLAIEQPYRTSWTPEERDSFEKASAAGCSKRPTFKSTRKSRYRSDRYGYTNRHKHSFDL